MNRDDLEEAAKAIKQSMTYLQESEEKITPSASVWWESSSDETQFFRESSGGRSDKYWFFHLFFLSISTMCHQAGLDEYGWPKAATFDEHDIECELPRLFGKYFNLLSSSDGSLYDCMEEEEQILNGRLPPPFNSHWDNGCYNYNDGRYTMAPARVLANWELDSGKSAFAWPIETFRNRCCDICMDEGNDIADAILKKLFREMKNREGELTGAIANIDDLVAPKKTHVRRWTTFENCFAYYSRGLEGDTFPQSFTKDILGMNRTKNRSEIQIDRLFLSFLVFQSEMMAAYLLENTRAVLLKHLSLEAVDSVFTVWKERLPSADRLPEIIV